MSAGPGSAGNVIAALCSLFIPGLGQLVQGRILAAIFYLLLASVLWLVTFTLLGWLGNLIACIDAALYRPRR